MDPRTLSARLHDILRPTERARRPDPGRSPTARLEDLDEALTGLRGLIQELGGHEPPRLPPRIKATVAALPEGRIPGTRATVQYRRRVRVTAGSKPAAGGSVVRLPPSSPRQVAEAAFRPAVANSAGDRT